MKKEELLDKAEAYFKNQLSKAERFAFEKEMARDDALSEEVRLYSRMIKANDEKDVANLRATMKGLLKEPSHKNEKLVKKLNSRSSILIIICIFLLIVFSYLILFRNRDNDKAKEAQEKVEQTTENKEQLIDQSEEQISPTIQNDEQSIPELTPNPSKAPDKGDNTNQRVQSPKSPQAIAMAYYEIPELILPGNSRTNRDTPLKNLSISEQARIAFQKGLSLKEFNKEQSEVDFQECIVLLNSLITKNQNTLAIFYRAHAQFQLARYAKAALDFEAAIKSRRFKEEAEWNLVLTNIIIGIEYQEMLKSITQNPNHKFYNKATALDKSLGK